MPEWLSPINQPPYVSHMLTSIISGELNRFIGVEIKKYYDSSSLQYSKKFTLWTVSTIINGHHQLNGWLCIRQPLSNSSQNVCHKIVDGQSPFSNEVDIKKEEEHIKQALKMCQCPEWTFNKTNEKMEEAKSRSKNTNRKDKTEWGSEKRGMVTLPYIKGVTEQIQKVMHKCRIQAPVKPHLNCRNLYTPKIK